MCSVIPRDPKSPVHLSSGIRQISAASSSTIVSCGSNRRPGVRTARALAWRAMCAVSAVTSGAVFLSSAPSRYTVPVSASSRSTSNGTPPGAAAAAAAGTDSQLSAGMIVVEMLERVRSLLSKNCMACCSNPAAFATRSSHSTSALPESSGCATQRCTSAIV